MRIFLIYLLPCMLCLGCRPAEQAPNQTTTATYSQHEDDLKQPLQAQTSSTWETSHVITSESAYYTTGPQQGRPADGNFTAGTKVRLVETMGSYSLVQLADGLTAYVTADALEPFRLAKKP
ncbi:MAG: hypothetical protein CMJ81_05460 [Planctomycetaceae bacterium]|jgi:uncharacterized protein YgiM (DUF1202 family)|nr:hypothetical protein [Planctomycetaceae bacterium]MBP60620.1 hypothetical protein [Planctomycetaceae bacterium]